MNKFLILNNPRDNQQLIGDMIRQLTNSKVDVIVVDSNVIYKYKYDKQSDIVNMVLALEAELMVSLSGYISSTENKEELEMGLELIPYISTGVKNLKEVLLEAKDISFNKKILNFILKGSGINEEFIQGFVANDLNVSKASKNMFVHRNTMNYKLDKLYANSGFDLRKFIDAYILYTLIRNK